MASLVVLKHPTRGRCRSSNSWQKRSITFIQHRLHPKQHTVEEEGKKCVTKQVCREKSTEVCKWWTGYYPMRPQETTWRM